MTEPIIVAETKVKDPRRVAAGKRLGAISKQRKEEKRLEREAQAQAQAQQVASTDNEYTLYLIGGGCGVLSIPKQRQGNANATANVYQR